MQPNGNKMDYDYYLYHYKNNFKNLHPEVSEHTAHDARHMLRNELRKLGVKDIIINSIIGHSNDDVGEDIYSHVSIEEMNSDLIEHCITLKGKVHFSEIKISYL